jgi:ATP-binding cassette subfamily F protein 3
LRSLLGCFMFSGDDVFKTLGVLSGGERNRYAMAKMLVSPANMLLLDEPTNHLDLRAKDVLLDAIRNFTGTVLFVSHDRYFIDGLATRVFEVEDRRVHIYPGNYEDYLWRKQGGPEKVTVALTNSGPPPPSVPVSVTNPPNDAKKPPVKKLNPIKLKLLEDEFSAAEEAIGEWERRIAAAEEKLGVFTNAGESQKASADLTRLRQEHAELLATWEDLGMQLEEQRD